MGSIVSSTVEKNMGKNQEFMIEMGRVNLERQIQMQNQMRERMVATQIARARELLYWVGSFYIMSALGMIAGYKKTRRPGILLPLLPLTFVVGYQTDLAYGNKLTRIKREAENIIQFETELLELPGGVPTPSSIDQARRLEEEVRKLHAAQPPLY